MLSTKCSVTKNLEIMPAKRLAYDALARYHYRGRCPAVYAAMYAIYDRKAPVGVIVYTMPAMELEMRNIVIPAIFSNCRNRTERLGIINRNIRCISRVIIEPRYRSLGLAAHLVRETIPLINVPVIEAVAAMGHINPFFEKAGMKAYPAKTPRQCARMLEALKTIGINEHLFVQPAAVQRRLDALCGELKFWLEHEMLRFLQAYGKRRNMPPGLERTRFILSKLAAQPIYYIWFSKEKQKVPKIN